MAVLFFYPYNLIFVFILANMLLAIMNTAYIESNTKNVDQKSKEKNKVRWLRVILCCLVRTRLFNKDTRERETPQNEEVEIRRDNFVQPETKERKETDIPEYLENLEKLGIYSRNEEDYKLWAIN